jgi:metallo-beta-lactamase family protein
MVGHPAEGTLGRILQKAAKSLRLQGDEFTMRARIRALDMYSGHPDATELADWVRTRLPLQLDLFLVHGNEAAIDALATRLVGSVAAGRILHPVLDGNA